MLQSLGIPFVLINLITCIIYVLVMSTYVDFAGICLLTAGSNIPVLYYGTHMFTPHLNTTACELIIVSSCACHVQDFIVRPRYVGHT
jgi:predicted membrane channel-forming protein YqfA (hemolysin III family)